MKRFNVRECTQEEFETRRKMFNVKHEMWDMIQKYYKDHNNEKKISFEENMVIIKAMELINEIDLDKVIAEAYEEELEN